MLFVGFEKRRILCGHRPCFASWLKKHVYYISNVLVSPHGLKNDEYYVSIASCLQSVCKFDNKGSTGVGLGKTVCKLDDCGTTGAEFCGRVF